jgi:hypothetical protein
MKSETQMKKKRERGENRNKKIPPSICCPSFLENWKKREQNNKMRGEHATLFLTNNCA